MEVSVYNKQGKIVGKEKLSAEIFSVAAKNEVLHRVVEAQLANKRNVVAATKNRGDVRGGGRKPWKQKGTGRARAGSSRSPIWKGGGVVFGPTPARNFKKRVNKKEKRKALLMAFSTKAMNKEVVIVDDLKFEKIKTQAVAEMLRSLSLSDKSVLLALAKKDSILIKSAANLSSAKTCLANNLNVYDILRYDILLLTKESLKVIADTFLKK